MASQVQWVSWMDDAKSIVITPETTYADIIVPTADTIRMSFLMDKLLTNKKPVSASVTEKKNKPLCIFPALFKFFSVCHLSLSAPVYRSNWYREDSDHCGQTAEEYAGGIHHALPHVFSPNVSQPDSRLHRLQVGQKVRKTFLRAESQSTFLLRLRLFLCLSGAKACSDRR